MAIPLAAPAAFIIRHRKAILAAAADRDSVGGIVECAVTGLPAGLGEPWFESVEGQLAAALFAYAAASDWKKVRKPGDGKKEFAKYAAERVLKEAAGRILKG